MKKEILEKIKELGSSHDYEMRNLATAMFWQHEGTYDELLYLEGKNKHLLSREQFERYKAGEQIIVNVSGYPEITLQKTVGESFPNGETFPQTEARVSAQMEYCKERKEKYVKANRFEEAAGWRDVERFWKEVLNGDGTNK